MLFMSQFMLESNRSLWQSSEPQLLHKLVEQLAHYSFRPAVEVLQCISSCSWWLAETEVAAPAMMANLLGRLGSLRHLEVSNMPIAMIAAARTCDVNYATHISASSQCCIHMHTGEESQTVYCPEVLTFVR